MPWSNLIRQRGLDFDMEMEKELVQRRVEHFYGSCSESAASLQTTNNTNTARIV
jgi:hypothetical protein